MLLPPADLDGREFGRLLADQYGAAGVPRFRPAGEDSWCYRLGGLWVSVRRDLRGHHPNAYAAARHLRLAGLDFVLAPVPGADGRVVHHVGRYPVVVFPYVPSRPLDPATDPRWCAERAAALIDRVHGADPGIALPREDFGLYCDAALDRALAAVRRGAAGAGPYGTRLGQLIGAHDPAIAAMRRELAELGRACAASPRPLVLTHGEPRAQNILRAGDGLLLADWGDAAWAPPERDWFHVRETLGLVPPGRREFLEFYRLRWILGEITEYATIFLAPHDGGAQDRLMWTHLTGYLPER